MTFEEIKQSLPNGFHDCTIREIHADFIGLAILLRMDLHISGEDDRDHPDRYRAGTLKVIRPYLFFLEPPDPSCPFIPRGEPLNASGASLKLGDNAKADALLERLPAEATAFVFFLDDWNSYLYVAGAAAEFLWNDQGASPAATRTSST